MTAPTLVDFFRARLDEAELVLSDPGVMGWGEVLETRERTRLDVKAKRSILDRWEASQDNNLPPEALIALDEVVKALALPYSDHPDYREEWKP